ncbi:NAD-dependent epimerase/dehydratase family protein [bacterium]|nr:NAD-dependent epimerase/dehydratase family protein [bacterium]
MKIRYALTGATGLVGSHLLWEILQQRVTDLESTQIFILGRGSKTQSLHARIKLLLQEGGLTYISLNKDIQQKILKAFDSICFFVDFDLTDDRQRLPRRVMFELTRAPIDFFYHVGANTDLRDGGVVEASLLRTNVSGTQNILKLISMLKIGIFSYVGTAYACGDVSGVVYPDNVSIEQTFRNPYEKTKIIAEVMVREYAIRNKVKIKCFRPSVVGGRLLEKPIGYVNKFDVFYGWAAFFLALKQKVVDNRANLYEKQIDLDMRICYSHNSGLNIVPVDFVAKALYILTVEQHRGESYHLVAKNELKHREYIAAILNAVNVGGVRRVSRMPYNLNHRELLYYRTAGKILTPYITRAPMYFSVENYESFISKHGLEVPCMDTIKFVSLLEFAKQSHFGIQ